MVVLLFLTVTVLYIGCGKQEAGIIQNNADIITDNISNEAGAPVLGKVKTVQEPLEVILKNEKTSIVMYLFPFDIATRIPVNEKWIMSWYETEIYIKHKSIYRVENLILTAYQEYLENPPTNIRILIEVLLEDVVVYTIPVAADGLEKEVLETFHKLLGIPLLRVLKNLRFLNSFKQGAFK